MSEVATCSILEQVAIDANKRKMQFYNLDVIVSVCYQFNTTKALSLAMGNTAFKRSSDPEGSHDEKRLKQK